MSSHHLQTSPLPAPAPAAPPQSLRHIPFLRHTPNPSGLLCPPDDITLGFCGTTLVSLLMLGHGDLSSRSMVLYPYTHFFLTEWGTHAFPPLSVPWGKNGPSMLKLCACCSLRQCLIYELKDRRSTFRDTEQSECKIRVEK